MEHLAKLPITQALAQAKVHACLALSRVFLLCTAVLILVMPWTEYFWHFDRFLRGGQDFELGLLAVLTSFCLVLLLFQLGQNSLQLAIALRRSLRHLIRTGCPAALPDVPSGMICWLHATPLPSPVLGKFTLPLQI